MIRRALTLAAATLIAATLGQAILTTALTLPETLARADAKGGRL